MSVHVKVRMFYYQVINWIFQYLSIKIKTDEERKRLHRYEQLFKSIESCNDYCERDLNDKLNDIIFYWPNLDEIKQNGKSPLYVAVELGFIDKANFLLKYKFKCDYDIKELALQKGWIYNRNSFSLN